MRSEFALSFNNRTWMPVEADVPADEQLQRCLSALDGQRHGSFILAPLPAGKSWPDVNPWKELDTYMQAAGSSDRMTIEIRRRAGERFEQLVVGRPVSHPPDQESTTVIYWDEFSVTVRDNEVFMVDEAVRLFASYLLTEALPPGYTVRPVGTTEV
jgi:hypothetical protein